MKSNRNALRPILFNTEMVQAIMDGRKTMTRRIVKMNWEITEPGKFELFDDGSFQFHFDNYPSIYDHPIYPPVYEGDILYVRETWAKLRFRKPVGAIPDDFQEEKIVFRADCEIANSDGSKFLWKPSIFMPKEASRIFLRVTEVRVERLQDMEEYDADQEGYRGCQFEKPIILSESEMEMCWNTSYCPVGYWYCNHTVPEGFGKDIWDETMKKADRPKYGWDANPWVYVICFEKLDISSYEEAKKAL